MSSSNYLRIAMETMPLLIGIALAYLFWTNNALLTILYLAIIAAILFVRRFPGDVHALVLGFFIGLLIEVTGTSVSGYQSFMNPDFLGIPVWLPVAWAFGFMMMKRIGMIIHESRT